MTFLKIFGCITLGSLAMGTLLLWLGAVMTLADSCLSGGEHILAIVIVWLGFGLPFALVVYWMEKRI